MLKSMKLTPEGNLETGGGGIGYDAGSRARAPQRHRAEGRLFGIGFAVLRGTAKTASRRNDTRAPPTSAAPGWGRTTYSSFPARTDRGSRREATATTPRAEPRPV